jgi:tryptophan synthase beta chain
MESDNGYFGLYGGRYVPEMLVDIVDEIYEAFKTMKNDNNFIEELNYYRNNFIGGPSPLIEAKNLRRYLGENAPQILLKNEGNNHTGAHKINHCVGQALLAKKLGKKRLIAETGAGQHGVATATVGAKFGLDVTVYMGFKDVIRQQPNVVKMKQLGAKVIAVKDGSQTLKDAVTAAMKEYMSTSEESYYVIGSTLGPRPYPEMNQYFQSVIGREISNQLNDIYDINKPTAIIACVGGGSNALGAFDNYISDKEVMLIGVEAGGKSNNLGEHAKRINTESSKKGIFQGYKSRFLQTNTGNIAPTHSISAGLDYPGISPQLAHLAESGRVVFSSACDAEVIASANLLARLEGVIPALESAHAIAYLMREVHIFNKSDVVVVNISGSGDKDLFTYASESNDKSFYEFLVQEVKKYEK